MIWIAVWYGFLSLITFAVYAMDKRKARLERWRIKESMLHLLDLAGGWPGGFLAQRMLHHKSRKTKFQVIFWCTVILHAGVLAAILFESSRVNAR